MRGKDKTTARPKKQVSRNSSIFKAASPFKARLLLSKSVGQDAVVEHDVVETTAAEDKAAAIQGLFGAEQETFTPIVVDQTPRFGAHAKTKTRKQYSKRNIAAIALPIVVVVILIAAWGGGAYYFDTHFGFNSTINNLDVSLKTAAEAEQAIAKQIANYSLTVEGREGARGVIKGSAIDLKYVPKGHAEAALDAQDPLLWPIRLFADVAEALPISDVTFSSLKLKNLLSQLAFTQPGSMRAPVDAVLRFDGKNYVVDPEDLGTTLDTYSLEHKAVLAVLESAPNLDLDALGCYVNPTIISTDKALIERQELLNKYVRFSITYEFKNGTTTTSRVLDGNTAIDWIKISKKDKGTLDDTALAAWVKQFAKEHKTKGTKRSFVGQDGKDYTVKGGNYGWVVNQKAEIEAIKTAIKKHTSETREPFYTQTAVVNPLAGEADWGDTFVEVNLKEQKMYYVVKGETVLDSDIVTGKMDGHDTPEGVYDVLEKKSPTVLVGNIMANGKPEYRSPVQYWMRITWEGVGLHDAPWNPSFGGTRYILNGSHGCINLPSKVAAELYPKLEMHTPVVVHW